MAFCSSLDESDKVDPVWVKAVTEVVVAEIDDVITSLDLQRDMDSFVKKTIVDENSEVDRLDLNYDEYKLLEIMRSGQSVIETGGTEKSHLFAGLEDSRFAQSVPDILKMNSLDIEQPRLHCRVLLSVTRPNAASGNNRATPEVREVCPEEDHHCVHELVLGPVPHHLPREGVE